VTYPIVVATLFEGDYERGAAALINSLSAHGYKGSVWCGIRGPRPNWYRPNGDCMQICSGVTIRIIDLDTPMHFANYKPYFLNQVAAYDLDVAAIVYSDPDIVLKCDWKFVEDWCSFGIAAVADENWNLPASSPIRRRWLRLCAELGLDTGRASTNSLNIYCNSGFVGVPRDHLDFVELWREVQETLIATGLAESEFMPGDSNGIIRGLDQDAFNIALMRNADHVSLLGPEGMDFAPGGYVLSHATGRPKPWDLSAIRSALNGRPPSKSHREFLRYAVGELEALPPSSVRRRIFEYKIARIIGAYYRRQDY
jgi:hypothetical protein